MAVPIALLDRLGYDARMTSRLLLLRPCLAAAALACACVGTSAHGADLTDLINDYRSAPAQCDGAASAALPALAPNRALASVHLGPGRFLQQELARAGVRTLHSQSIGISGTHDAHAAMQLLRQRYCRSLRDTRFTDIGVAEEDNGWSIILARPFVLAPLPAQARAEQAILDATNHARARARTCGTERYPAAPPLRWNGALSQAAQTHSADMAALRYFSHQDQDGRQVNERARAAGYAWQRIGENIASGMRTAEEAVAGWLDSPGHCANIMSPGFTEMGAGYGQAASATGDPDDGIVYWTQVFGKAR